MASDDPKDGTQAEATADRAAPPPEPKPRRAPSQANRVLAYMLAGVVALVFMALMVVILLLHWAKVHHAIPHS